MQSVFMTLYWWFWLLVKQDAWMNITGSGEWYFIQSRTIYIVVYSIADLL